MKILTIILPKFKDFENQIEYTSGRIFIQFFYLNNRLFWSNKCTGGDYNTGYLGLYKTGILTAITPLGQKRVRCFSHPPVHLLDSNRNFYTLVMILVIE